MFPQPQVHQVYTEGMKMRDDVNSMLAYCRKIRAYMESLMRKAVSLEEQCTAPANPLKERGKAAEDLFKVQEELRRVLSKIEEERYKATQLRMKALEMQYGEAVDALDQLDRFYEALKSSALQIINARQPPKLPFDPRTYVCHDADNSVYLETPEMRAEYWITMGMAQQRPTSYERVMEENIAMRREAQQHPELLEQWRAHPETRSEFRRLLSARRDEELMRAPEGDPVRRPRLDW